MIPCKPGDVILVHFPFTSPRALKKRPGVVISNEDFTSRYGDVVIMALTGVEQDESGELRDWEAAGLLKPTWIKPILATTEQILIERRLGRLSSGDRKKAAGVLNAVLDSEFLG
jgi:mRNA interferase MazF